MAELVDALASGASGSNIPWRFESSSGHKNEVLIPTFQLGEIPPCGTSLPVGTGKCYNSSSCGRGGIGIRAALRRLYREVWRFNSSRPHLKFGTISSAGRASHLHCECRGFKSLIVHNLFIRYEVEIYFRWIQQHVFVV
jgi:hypothetical protein